ncbi:MAG: hypothetical protein JXQ99_04100 [Hyphomicrobiaceae bacterium]
MARARTSPPVLDERSASRVHRQASNASAFGGHPAPNTGGDTSATDTHYEDVLSADRLIDRLQAHEQLAAALNAEADKCTERAAHLVDSGCTALPKTTDDPALREKILQDILRYRQAPMRRLEYRPFSGERTVCPRCWVMDGRRCTGPIDPTGQFYACLGCGPTWKISHLHKL